MSEEQRIELERYIKKYINELIETTDKEINILPEGINIDHGRQTITFDPTHEDNIDTSTVLNPTYYNVNGYPVISIFKRKVNDERTDGTPLIYALKGINGWKIDDNSILELLKRFIRITETIKPIYDTIVVVDSNSTLNIKILHRLNKIIKANKVIYGLFEKLEANDILLHHLNCSRLPPKDVDDLSKIITKMASTDNKFSFKKIPTKYRHCISKSIDYAGPDSVLEYKDFINDKNILILDDTLTTGTTVSEYCKNILDTFTPKSVTVITLFSKL